jgi:hypothetical protein
VYSITSWFLLATCSTSWQQTHSSSLSIIWQCSHKHPTITNSYAGNDIIQDHENSICQYKPQIMMFYQSRLPKRTNDSSSSIDILWLSSLSANSALTLLVFRLGSNW